MKSIEPGRSVTRRHFMRIAALGGISVLVAACQPKVVEKIVRETVQVEKIVKETVQVEKVVKETVQVEKVVAATPAGPTELVLHVLLDAWMCDSMALLQSVQRYNEKYAGKIRIAGDRTPTGWETKVLQMVRAGNPYWDAKWHMTQFWDMVRMVETGLIQPIDPYVESSKLPWASQYKTKCMPAVYEAGFYKGHQYGLSDYLSRNVVFYRKDYLAEAGWEKPPDTWDEFTKCAKDVNAKLGSKGIVAVNPELPWRRAIHSLFLCNVKNFEEAYDAQDYDKARYMSTAFKDVLQMVRGWFDAKLCTLDCWQNPADYLSRGMVAMNIGAELRIPTVRKIWGVDKIDAVNIPVPKAGMPSRTNWEADIPVVFRNAAHPQEAFDWICESLAWEGDVAKVWQEFAGWNFGLLTPYADLNAKLFSGKPEHDWLVKSLEMVSNSWITPRNVSFLIIGDKLGVYLDKIWARQMEIDEALNAADKEINDEIAKQISAIKAM